MGKQSKNNTKTSTAVAEKKTDDKSAPVVPAGDFSASIVEYLGETLLTSTKEPPKPTVELLKGKDIVALYFAASWYVNNSEKEYSS